MQTASGFPDTMYLRFSQERIAQSVRSLGRVRRSRTRVAGNRLLDCLQGFVDTGRAPLAHVLGDQARATEWEQYQGTDGAPVDGTPGELHYFYHAHAMHGAAKAEHGHFHLFAQLGADAGGRPRYAHLLAIGVDARGLPLRLFTTNRWVTDETWISANRVIALTAKIAAAGVTDDSRIQQWLRLQLGVFAPQITELLRHRDRRMNLRLRRGGRPGLFEDRRIHVISQCQVSVEHQLMALDRSIHT